MEFKQTKKILLEVLLVAIFFILLVCGVIYIFNKIIESQPVQSSITFVSQEEALIEENIKDIKLWIEDFSEKTENHLDQLSLWLHLKSKPIESKENLDTALTVTPTDSNPIESENSTVTIQENNLEASKIPEPDLSTPEKIKEFQKSQGIPATGVIGDLTKNALKRLKEAENNTVGTYHEPDLSSPEKIKEFQKSQGIPTTGVIGELTRNALKRLQENAMNSNASPTLDNIKPNKN